MGLEFFSSLLSHGYRKCFYIAYYCPNCGSCRLMTAALPQREYINCHRCARPHCHNGLLASGYTWRALPQCEVWSEPIDVDQFTGLTDPKPPKRAAKARELDGDHFVSARGRVRKLGPKVGSRAVRYG